MPKNLSSFSQPALTDAVEFNLQELGTLLGHALDADFYHEPELAWFISHIPYWWCNWVTKSQFMRNTPQERIDTLLKRLKGYQLPMFWVVDSSSSSDFLSQIETYGWRGGAMTIWARDLQILDMLPANPEGVTVELVDNSEALKQWVHAFVFGYDGQPGYLYEHAVALLQKKGFVRTPGVHYYLGRLNGEPVTSTLLLLGGGVAGIYDTATLPHARRHGVATSVVRTAMEGARAMGYHIVTLQASEMGRPVYRRLGFEEHGAVNFYMLPGSSETSELQTEPM